MPQPLKCPSWVVHIKEKIGAITLQLTFHPLTPHHGTHTTSGCHQYRERCPQNGLTCFPTSRSCELNVAPCMTPGLCLFWTVLTCSNVAPCWTSGLCLHVTCTTITVGCLTMHIHRVATVVCCLQRLWCGGQASRLCGACCGQQLAW